MPVKFQQIVRIMNLFEYKNTRTTGSHYKFEKNNKWITIPYHKELNIKTARTIVKSLAENENISFKELVKKFNLKF